MLRSILNEQKVWIAITAAVIIVIMACAFYGYLSGAWDDPKGTSQIYPTADAAASA